MLYTYRLALLLTSPDFWGQTIEKFVCVAGYKINGAKLELGLVYCCSGFCPSYTTYIDVASVSGIYRRKLIKLIKEHTFPKLCVGVIQEQWNLS